VPAVMSGIGSGAAVAPIVHQTWPRRVVFGEGAVVHVAAELAALGAGRVLLIHTPGRTRVAERIAADLGRAWAGSISEARQHVRAEDAAVAAEKASDLGADWLLAVGGGAATGLAKAVALEACMPVAAVPTTYSGSEMTAIWGITANGEKVNGRNERVRPRLVVYDPGLLVGLPPPTAAASALNAMAHCVEALYAADASFLVRLTAEEGARALAEGLDLLAEGCAAEASLLRGAWCAGDALGAAAMGLHHKLCHVLGGMFGLPHAEMHAILLPYLIAFNAPAAPEAISRLCRALGVADAAACARQLRATALRLGVPPSLAQIGMPADGVAAAAAAAGRAAYANPRRAGAPEIETLLEAALRGVDPADPNLNRRP
jgi:maleylacetate reductase